MMLRGGNIPARDTRLRHTYLTDRLYMRVLETEIMLPARLSRLVAWSALHSHESADLEKAGQAMRLHYIDALAAVPYMTGGLSGEGMLHQERLDAVARYKQHKESVLQGRQLRPRRDKMSGITKVEKKHGVR